MLSRRTPYWVSVVGLPLLAFFFRIWQLPAVPSGLLWDEGGSGLDVTPLFRGQWPIFFEGHSGHEPLLFYTQAASLKLLGWTPFALRLPAVFFTTLAVAASFAVVRKLFGLRVACLAALLMAVSEWQVSMGRLGRDNSALPLFGAITVFWLVVWLRDNGGWLAPALCGLAFGLALYTYSPARFLVFVIAAGWLHAFAFSPKRRATLLQQGALAAAVSALVFAPLGVYFARHPPAFFERASELSIFNPQFGPPLDNWLRALKATFLMFWWRGEPGWDKSMAGQPMFDPLLACLLAAGLLLALWRSRHFAYFLVLAWLGFMLVPLTLTARDLPDFGRVIGIAPAVFVFPALAAAAAWKCWPPARWLVIAGAAIVIPFGYWQYFVEWANAPGRVAVYRPEILAAGQSAIGRLLSSAPPPRVYFGTEEPFDAVTDFLIAGFQIEHPALADRLVGYDARTTRVLGGNGAESYLIERGRPAVSALPPLQDRLDLQLQTALRLDSCSLPAVVAPGQTLTFQLQWEPLHFAGQLTLFAHVVDYQQRQTIASLDQNGFPPSAWRGGETVQSTFPLAIPEDATPGAYWLELGAYTDDGRRLPSADGRESLWLGPVVVAHPPPATTATPAARLGPVALLAPHVSRAGDGLDVELPLLPAGPLDGNYSVFVHVLDDAGRLVAQADGPPANGEWPSRFWQPELPVDDKRHVTLPAGLTAGTYHVTAGLYRLDSGQRLPGDPAGPEPGSVSLGEVRLP
ncbi:MAG TPA: glycosyltransferase family 39 protein [Chloroflexota bacterium]|nr:glycosyltransferase family 39 protein [Chloroflexota bacterium]